MSNLLKPWELQNSDDVYVIEYEPLIIPRENMTEEEMKAEQAKQDRENYVNAELKQRQKTFEDMLMQREQEIMASANKRAEEIILSANRRASTEKETIIGDALVEADSIRDKAFSVGYKEGYDNNEDSLKNCIAKIQNTLEDMKQSYQKEIFQIKEEVGNLAMQAASKVLRKRLNENELEMKELVSEVMQENKNNDWISVEVSEKMPQLINYIETELSQKYVRMKIIKSADEFGKCVVNSPSGVVDASIETQIANLKELINTMRAQ